ncbi:sulfurtransferase FdhD [Pigmentiphaga litoralis]|uniref:formate dehydrogenase accessory sulfurtransferase FdhD n=1 Tax=Pigmentiphaga litoralis TaxID=516702 RepID=UPI001671CB9A|nr:formate dehydrogenase accessory sulfurtransferase FdhD [Pigmentiphaga litoralis]GGX05811.1 sulfurtransferase FdhD [Pigmentiphaga litoralis]
MTDIPTSPDLQACAFAPGGIGPTEGGAGQEAYGDLTAVPTSRTVAAQRATAEAETAIDVVVAEETPIALVFNGISHAVMMATPADLEAFALGFALSEGILDGIAACRDIELQGSPLGIEVHLSIGSAEFARLKDRRRSLAGRTGCGLCGIDSLAALDLHSGPVARPAWTRGLSLDTVMSAMSALPDHQPLNALTGGVHAAAWALPDGTLYKVMEDVGRHNALDKLIGWLAQEADGGTVPDGFVAMSSRASYELVRKCARMGYPALTTISAPSALAIELATQADMALYSFCRPPKGMTRFVA